MRRRHRLLGWAMLNCLFFAGWVSVSGGILDGPMARDVRTSSVHVGAGVELDEAAAERVIGNRRLVVIVLSPGADLRDGCDAVRRAAAGTLVLLLSRDGEDYDTYGCALLPDADEENFGRAYVAESVIGRGVDQFVDDPLSALKVVTVNYDLLVKAGTVPDGARTVSPSLPRYLAAAAAVVAVLVGSVVVYAVGRRAGRLAATRRRRLAAGGDRRTVVGAATAVLAQQIIDLDRRYAALPATPGSDDTARRFVRDYQRLVADYTGLLDVVAAIGDRDGAELESLSRQVESLTVRARALAAQGPQPSKFGSSAR